MRRLLGELAQRPGFARLGLEPEVSEEALEWLLGRGVDPRNGVRYLRRTVEREVGKRLAEVLVRGEVGRGEGLRVEAEGGGLQVRSLPVRYGQGGGRVPLITV